MSEVEAVIHEGSHPVLNSAEIKSQLAELRERERQLETEKQRLAPDVFARRPVAVEAFKTVLAELRSLNADEDLLLVVLSEAEHGEAAARIERDADKIDAHRAKASELAQALIHLGESAESHLRALGDDLREIRRHEAELLGEMSLAKLDGDNWRRITAFAENRVYRVLTGNAFPGNRTIDEHSRSVMARFQDLPSIKERVN